MKNIWKSLFVAALFVSCSESMTEEAAAPEVNNGKAIKFEVVNEGGRAAFFQGEGHGVAFEAGDELGIRGWYSQTLNSTTRMRANYQIGEDGKSLTQTSTWNNPVEWKDGEETHITAHYPATNNASANNIGEVTLPSVQTQAAADDHRHIGDYMIMSTSKPYVFAADNHPASVTLSLQNVLSIVEVTLTGSEAVEVASLTMQTSSGAPLAFSAGKLDTTLNLAETDTAITVTTGVAAVTLKLTTPATVDAKGAKFYFVVLPGTHDKNDIVLSAYTTDGTEYSVEMGAITFEMNKVYRPKLDLAQFEKVEVAEIEHIFEDEDGAKVYAQPSYFNASGLMLINRPYYPFRQIPASVENLQIASINSSSYPATNKIKALTDGYVYMLVGSSEDATVSNATASDQFLTGAGWSRMTDLPTAEITAVDQVTSGLVYYANVANTNNFAPLVIYRKLMQQDEEFDLSAYPVKAFQGIRPIAKKITNRTSKYLVLNFNFMNDDQGWTARGSYSKILSNPFKGVQTYTFPTGSAYNLEFTYTEGLSGTATHEDGYLMMHIRNSGAESIGLPAVEGFKLTKVEGVTHKASLGTPTVVVSSKPAHADGAPVKVSNEFTFTNNSNKVFALTLTESAANTPYYFYATDAIDGKNDPALLSLVATYEKVE